MPQSPQSCLHDCGLYNTKSPSKATCFQISRKLQKIVNIRHLVVRISRIGNQATPKVFIFYRLSANLMDRPALFAPILPLKRKPHRPSGGWGVKIGMRL